MTDSSMEWFANRGQSMDEMYLWSSAVGQCRALVHGHDTAVPQKNEALPVR